MGAQLTKGYTLTGVSLLFVSLSPRLAPRNCRTVSARSSYRPGMVEGWTEDGCTMDGCWDRALA
jgi:hypothetical protein